jgi:hypothetical protein
MKVIREDFEVEFIHTNDNPDDDNEDIIISYKGQRYSATVFTLENIKSIIDRYAVSGECASGLYFYCPDLIIVKNLKRATILDAISNIISEGEIDIALKKIP